MLTISHASQVLILASFDHLSNVTTGLDSVSAQLRSMGEDSPLQKQNLGGGGSSSAGGFRSPPPPSGGLSGGNVATGVMAGGASLHLFLLSPRIHTYSCYVSVHVSHSDLLSYLHDSFKSRSFAGEILASGVFRGVAGLFTKPMEGFAKDGLQGAITGMGKGLVGAVTNTAAGAVGFAARTVEGLNETVQ